MHFAMQSYTRCGGLPRGRMVEIFGEPQSGKTSLALSCLRAALRNKQSCAVPGQTWVSYGSMIWG